MAKILSNFLLTNHLSFKATAKVRSLFLMASINEFIFKKYFQKRSTSYPIVLGMAKINDCPVIMLTFDQLFFIKILIYLFDDINTLDKQRRRII